MLIVIVNRILEEHSVIRVLSFFIFLHTQRPSIQLKRKNKCRETKSKMSTKTNEKEQYQDTKTKKDEEESTVSNFTCIKICQDLKKYSTCL
jgi:hypothetical protein